MDEKESIELDFVHLAHFAVKGQHKNVRLFLRTLANKYRKTKPNFAKNLDGIAAASNPIREILREEPEAVSLPTDSDSKQDLLLIEDPVELDLAPVWSKKLDDLFGQILREYENADELKKAGLNPSRALLFYGPPGVGKTLAARWFAHNLKMPLLILDLATVMSSYLGKTGNNIRAVLDYAKHKPSILLLDEFDAIAKKRSDESEIGELKRLVSVLLQTVDQWDSQGMLIAASNHPELLDPAVWRRFDLAIEFELPSKNLMHDALKSFFGPKNIEVKEWLQILTEVLEGKTFSDAERVANSIRRSVIINHCSMEESISGTLANFSHDLPHKNKINLAHRLIELGLSQRRVSDILGVARDTIRHSKIERE